MKSQGVECQGAGGVARACTAEHEQQLGRLFRQGKARWPSQGQARASLQSSDLSVLLPGCVLLAVPPALRP